MHALTPPRSAFLYLQFLAYSSCNNAPHLNGGYCGDWFFPGSKVGMGNECGDSDIYQLRSNQIVDLRRRNNALSPSGIYRCEVPISADHNGDDSSVTGTVYLGLYATGGNDILRGVVIVIN